MIGFPGETLEDIHATADLAFSLPAMAIRFEIVCPHPGTELLRYLQDKYGVERIDWEQFNVYNSPYPLSEVDSAELYKILKKLRRKARILGLQRWLRKKFG